MCEDNIDQTLGNSVIEKIKEMLKLRLRSANKTQNMSENGLMIEKWPEMLQELIDESEPALKVRLEGIKGTHSASSSHVTLRSKNALERILYCNSTTTTTTTTSSSSAHPPPDTYNQDYDYDSESSFNGVAPNHMDNDDMVPFTLPKRYIPVGHTFNGWGTHNGVYLEPTTSHNDVFRCLWKDDEDNSW